MSMFRNGSKSLAKHLLWLGLLPSLSFAFETSVTLRADSEITPSASELVTFGLPVAEGEVTSPAEVRVSVGGVEVPAYVAIGLRHHWSDNSARSLTIQVPNVDMSGGDITLQISDAGSTVARVPQQAHSVGWTNAGADKDNVPYPRIFALHSPAYLAETGIIPPFDPAPQGGDAFSNFRSQQFDNNFGGLNYGNSSSANWLFDRSSAMFKSYMTSGDVKFLKEAILSKQYYFKHVRDDDSSPAQAGGRGCWTRVACADGKYIAPQQAKLAWALVGDNSQWDNSLIVDMALQSDLGWNQYGSRDTFNLENEGFTERGAGIAGLAAITAYEMTGNATLLSHIVERIDSLQDMQQTVKSWDAANNWAPKSGGWTHNLDVHEGIESQDSAPSGDTNARGFSAWMSENIVDFLWQAYWVTGNDKIPGMLTRVANAVDTYGFTSSYNAGTGNHVRKPEFNTGQIHAQSCNSTREDTDLLYFASAYADSATRTSDDWWPYYSDNHNIETVLILAAGYHFETDEAVRTRLAARIDKLISGWSNSNCARVFSGVYRLFNWQHRSNSVRTWDWISRQSGRVTIDPVQPPVGSNSPPGLATVDSIKVDGVEVGSGDSSNNGSGNGSGDGSSNGGSGSGDSGGSSEPAVPTSTSVAVLVGATTCSIGDDPHWECPGSWMAFENVPSGSVVGICADRESSNYDGCLAQYRQYELVSNVTAADGFLVCDGTVAAGAGKSACSGSSQKWARASNFDDLSGVTTTPGGSGDGGSGSTGGSTGSGSDSGGGDSGGDSGSGSQSESGGGTGGEPSDPTTPPPPPPQTGASDELVFTDVTGQVINQLRGVDQRFWAGMPDVNGDGCFDIFVGTHQDSISSAMYLQDNENGCRGTFSYFANSNNYTQTTRAVPRVTGRYQFGNWAGNDDGLWSFWGTDIDGSAAAIYEISDNMQPGQTPVYKSKRSLCQSVARCWVIDTDGDGDLELVHSDKDLDVVREIRDIQTGAVTHAIDRSGGDHHHVVFDTNNDTYPDIVNIASGSTWRFNPGSGRFDLIAGTHSRGSSGTSNHSIVIDYDSDGDSDFITVQGSWQSDGFVTWNVHRNDGGTFTQVASQAGFPQMNLKNEDYWTIYANNYVADMNLDGHPDILFAGSEYGRDLHILINNGDGTFSKWDDQDFGQGGASSGKVWVGARDYDNDGDLDIVKADDGPGTMRLWRNDSNLSNHWLRVRAIGEGNNTDGMHTRITVRNPANNAIVSSYEIQQQLSGAALIPHIGVGTLERVNVEVTWPHNGGRQVHQNVAVDQDIIVYKTGQYRSYTPGTAKPMTAQ